MRAKAKFKADHPDEPLDKFSIFDSYYYRNYGNVEIKLLCEHYGQEKLDSSQKKHDSLVDYESCVHEAKKIIYNNPEIESMDGWYLFTKEYAELSKFD